MFIFNILYQLEKSFEKMKSDIIQFIREPETAKMVHPSLLHIQHRTWKKMLQTTFGLINNQQKHSLIIIVTDEGID